MKVRITTNRIRVRLHEDEVRMLAGGESVNCAVDFGVSGRLTHELVPSPDVERLEALLTGSHVRIFLPSDRLKDWPDSRRIGFEGEVVNADGNSFSILIEKDFPCKHQDQQNPD